MSFNLSNVQKNDLTVKKSVEVQKGVKDKTFFSFFFKTKMTTEIIGISGQVLSGLTEFTAIYKACGGDFVEWQSIENIIPALVGIFAVFIFEVVGVRIYLVKIVRQYMKKDFDKKQATTLFRFHIVFCSVILLANIATSVISVFTGFESEKIDDKYEKLALIDEQEIKKKNKISQKYKSLDSALVAQSIIDKNFQNDTYQKTMKILSNSAWVARDNANEREKIAAKITTLTNTHTETIQSIDNNLKTEKEENMISKKSDITIIEAWATSKRNDINSSSNTQNMILGIFQKFSIVFLIIFILLGVGAIIYSEIFFSGSETDFQIEEKAVKPNLLLVLIIGFYQRFIYHPAYIFVSWIVGSKSYEYTKILQDKETFSSTDALNTRLKMPTIRMNVNAPKTRRRIAGFTTQPSELQQQTSVTDATKNAVLEKYNFNTVASWYKRSNLIKKSLSKSDKSKVNNTDKYLKAKSELESVGVKFIERKNNVTIKL